MAKIQTRENQRNTSSNRVFPSGDFMGAANLNLFYNKIFFFFENANVSLGREHSYYLVTVTEE